MALAVVQPPEQHPKCFVVTLRQFATVTRRRAEAAIDVGAELAAGQAPDALGERDEARARRPRVEVRQEERSLGTDATRHGVLGVPGQGRANPLQLVSTDEQVGGLELVVIGPIGCDRDHVVG